MHRRQRAGTTKSKKLPSWIGGVPARAGWWIGRPSKPVLSTTPVSPPVHEGNLVRSIFAAGGVLVFALLLLARPASAQEASDKTWLSLFNGQDLDGWITKIHHHEAGVNYGETFRAEDGIIKVRYDAYGDFNDQPQIGGGIVEGYDPALKQDGKLLQEGYIALQSEGQPIDFRKVELLNLEGCTDPQATNFKDYFVKPDPAACRYAEGGK